MTFVNRFLFALLFCAFFAFIPASAQSRTDVEGHIRDEHGSALTGAAVQLFAEGSLLSRYATVSNAEGRFVIERVPAGRYDMMVSFLGFGTIRMSISVTTDIMAPVHVVLSTQAVQHDEVVVSIGRATPHLSPVTLSNISGAELARQPDMKDLPVHLARQPSITFYSENGNAIGYSTLRMRGFGQRRLAVAINGIPQNDPEEFNVFWINFFDIQGAVQDIQIQRGAGSSVYGPTAIGGAINIRAMPYKPDFEASVHVGGGAFATRRFSGEINSGLLNDRYVAYGRLSRLLSDGYRDWSWTEFWRFFGGITRYGDRSTLTLQAYGGPQKDGLAYAGIPKAANEGEIDDGFGGTIDRKYNFSALTRDVESFHQPHIELHHTFDINSSLQFSQTAFGVQGKGYFDFGGTFRSADYLRLPESTVSGAARAEPLFVSLPSASVLFRAYLDQWQVGWMPKITQTNSKATSTVGAEFRLHRSLRWGRIQEADGLPANLVGADHDVRVYSFRGEKAIASVYMSHLNRISDLWAVQADVQLTYRQYRVWDEAFIGTQFSKPYYFANPRIGITFRPEQSWSGFASLALAHREPRMKSLYDGEEAGAGFEPLFNLDAQGNLDMDKPFIKPERLIDLELGTRWSGEKFRASANVFVMDFQDEIVPSGGLDQYGVPRTGNADRTRHIGLEMEGAVRLAPGLDLAGNATISRNRFISFAEFVTLPDFSTTEIDRASNPIAGFPATSGNMRLDYSKKGFSASIMSSLVGTQYVDNGEGENASGLPQEDLKLEAYMLVDASISYLFSSTGKFAGLKLGLDLNNVLNDEVLTYGNVSFGATQFFPAATRHAFFSARYTLK